MTIAMATKTKITFPFVSTPNVTDNGEAVEESRATTQAISYIPYGEVFVEQQAGGWSSPYLFNAKELDSETGLYYYGARYLDPSDAMWLSVDPLWEDYVGFSPYSFCANNPIIIKDEDGEWLNFVVGALVGAASDYVLQVASNAIENRGFSTECFTNVDTKSIVASGVSGAVGVGIGNTASKIAKVAQASKGVSKASCQGKVIAETYQIGSDVVTSAAGQKIQGQEVSLESCIVDAIGGSVGRKLSTNLETKRSKQQKILEKTADRLERTAGLSGRNANGGVGARQSRIENAKEARQKVTNYEKETQVRSEIAGGVGSNLTSKSIDKICESNNQE